MDKNDILLSYAKDAYIAESYASNTVTVLAKESSDAVLLQFLIDQRDIINRKRDKVAMVIRRHGGIIPEALDGDLALIPKPGGEPLSSEELALYATMDVYAFGHMMMGSYMGLVNLAKLYPNDFTARLLSENLMDTIRTVDLAYANLPKEVQDTLASPTMRPAA